MDWSVALVLLGAFSSVVTLSVLRERSVARESERARALLQEQGEVVKSAVGQLAGLAGVVAANSIGGRPQALFDAELDLKRREFDSNQRRMDEEVALRREALEQQREALAERRRMMGRNPEHS